MPRVYQYEFLVNRLALTLNDEQPLPSWDSGVVDLEHSERDQTTEGSSKERTTEEERNTESKFSTSIEQRQVEHHTSEEASCTQSVRRRPDLLLNLPSKAPSSSRMTSMPAKFFAAHWNSAIAPQPTITNRISFRVTFQADTTYSWVA